jgi:hypothetical protein
MVAPPQYAIQLRGLDRCPFVGFVRGADSLSNKTAAGFRVVLVYEVLSSQQMMQYARFCQWRISWVGDQVRDDASDSERERQREVRDDANDSERERGKER